MFNGEGSLTNSANETYTGEWRYSKKHGVGKYTWPNGDYYYGPFENGKRHGEAKLRIDNKVRNGLFRHDNFAGWIDEPDTQM